MSASRLQAAAAWLADAHARRETFRPLPDELAPASEADAYAVQDAFIAMRAERAGAIVGYKIALSTPAMQRFVGVDRPQAGVIFESTLHTSPARVAARNYQRLIVEFEIGVRMATDLTFGDAPHTRERVAACVGAVMPALELADDRHADYATLRTCPLHLIADNAWNEGAVLGPERVDWQALDLAALRGVASVNGRVLGEGTGADALGHPLDAVAWVAGHLASLGRGLMRGDVVITGSLVPSHFARPGENIRFELEGLGAAELVVD